MDLDAFQCRCNKCEYKHPDIALKILIREVEKYFQREIMISSGYRCADHNAQVGGSKNSYHTKAMAVDFYIPEIELAEIYRFLDNSTFRLGLGRYNTHIHMDSRSESARWDYRTSGT